MKRIVDELQQRQQAIEQKIQDNERRLEFLEAQVRRERLEAESELRERRVEGNG